VWEDVINKCIDGNDVLIGLMLEGNLKEGNQKNTGDISALEYGVSITDACLSWEASEQLLSAHEHLSRQFNLDRELTDMDAGFKGR
jgi:3-deoxy-7-phosphoheptulonate synthase